MLNAWRKSGIFHDRRGEGDHVELLQEPESTELEMEEDMAGVAPPEEIDVKVYTFTTVLEEYQN